VASAYRYLVSLLVLASLALPAAVYAQAADGSDQLTLMPSNQPMPIPQAQPGGLLVRARPSQSVVDLARTNAAERTGTALDQITVVSVEATEWPDFSLGCAGSAPHMVFAEVIVPGYLIELDAAGTRLSYHTDGGLRVLLCDSPLTPQTDPGTD